MRIARISSLAAILSIAALPHGAAAQQVSARTMADSLRRAIDAATRAGSLPRLYEARGLATRALAAYPDDGLLLHYDGFLRYRIVTVSGPSLSPRDQMRTIDEARVALEHSASRRPMAESYLLLSELYGRQVAAEPSRGAALGKATALARARAMSLGSQNPRVYLLAGIAALYGSPDAGGGMQAAERLLRASLTLFAHDTARAPEPMWGHAEAWAWLGQVLQRTGRTGDASAMYARALALEPDNVWVRDVLVPGVR